MTTDRATATERESVDVVLGSPDSGWSGGARASSDFHIARGGFHQAQQNRNMLLPALLALQSSAGWISPGGLNYVSERLGVPPAEAYGVASFYALLSTELRPPRALYVCDDIACAQIGAEQLISDVESFVLGDPEAIVIRSPCLGQCDKAPAVFLQTAGGEDAAVAPADLSIVRQAVIGNFPSTVHPSDTFGNGPSFLLHRVGEIDPTSIAAYRATGGYKALPVALEAGPESVVAEIKASRIRGRGGAAFPMGFKWEAVAGADDPERYVVCNADESEPGTFKDRVLLEGDPFSIIEAMTIAGFAVSASKGFVYIRGEYPLAISRIEAAVAQAEESGLLGDNVYGSDFSFRIQVRSGAGAYICGEETALFNSIEGFRGEPRNKPPFPTQSGLFGKPTAINNVETLANVSQIVLQGGEKFTSIGTAESTGTKLFCLSGAVEKPGVYEVEFGMTLGELLEIAGGAKGEIAAILLGGAAGSFIGLDAVDLPLTFEDTQAAGLSLGSGVIMPFLVGVDFEAVVQRIASFFRDESCGQCVPCRVGTVRQEEALHRIASGRNPDTLNEEFVLLDDLDRVMRDASICGLGQTAGTAVQSAIGLGLIGGSS